MNVLILGSGGREHAFAWKIAQSPLLKNLYVAPGNAGTALHANNISIAVDDFEGIKNICLKHQINLVVVGPEDPLVKGIREFFEKDSVLKNIALIGPGKIGAQLEGSKDFAKAFMKRHQIPTASYETFTKGSIQKGFEFIDQNPGPYVLKADGLAAGKGVVILDDQTEAKDCLKKMLFGEYLGDAGSKVVIEQFLKGIELSTFVLTDGAYYLRLPEAKDYKRIGEGDTGLNTGGMGAVSPVPFADQAFMEKVEQRIIKPTIEGLKNDQIPYQGFIFIGLMNVGGEPYVIEYNCRMGDPETEVVIPRINNDLLEIFVAVSKKQVQNIALNINPSFCTTVMMVSGGYPGNYEKGFDIRGIDQVQEAIIFQAGTKHINDKIVTNGGRVLTSTAFGNSIQEATQKSYQALSHIHFDYNYYRRDIGQDLMK